MKEFRGTGVALITPFKNYDVDFTALERCIEFVIAGGVDYIVSLGSTGECVTLSEEEKRQVLTRTIEIVHSRVPVVAGNFGGNDTRRLCSYIDSFDFTGISAILSSSPSYNKPTQEGIYLHYKQVADHAPLPVILYNVPGRTASNIDAQTTVRLARTCPTICGIKEASGDLSQAAGIIENVRGDFHVLSGDDPSALDLIAAGGDGVISVIANGLPSLFSQMVHNALDGNMQAARDIDTLLQELHPLLYVEGNPAGIKALMGIQQLSTREVRLPLTPLTEENTRRLHAVWNEVTANIPLSAS